MVPIHFQLDIKKKNFTDIQLIYNVCVNFCCAAKWLSYTYIAFFFHIFSNMVGHKCFKMTFKHSALQIPMLFLPPETPIGGRAVL